MATLENHKGLEVLDAAIGEGGKAINDDLKLLVDWNPKCNWEAANDPTKDDDSREEEEQNYQVGSRWFNTTTGTLFICVDATEGEAVWRGTANGVVSRSASATLNNSAGPLLLDPADATGFIKLGIGLWAFEIAVFAKAIAGFAQFDAAAWALKGAVFSESLLSARMLGNVEKTQWTDAKVPITDWDVDVQIQNSGIKVQASANDPRDVDWYAIINLKEMA